MILDYPSGPSAITGIYNHNVILIRRGRKIRGRRRKDGSRGQKGVKMLCC